MHFLVLFIYGHGTGSLIILYVQLFWSQKFLQVECLIYHQQDKEHTSAEQEAQLSPRDRAMRRLN